MPKALFITNKYVDGLGSPISFHFEGLVQTFTECTDWEYDTLAIDEATQLTDIHIDELLEFYLDKTKIDVIFIIRMGISDWNPSEDMLDWLTCQRPDIKKVFIWEDSNPWDLDYQKRYDCYIDLNIVLDNPSFGGKPYISDNLKTLTLWTPESQRLYHPVENPTIPVSFIGSLRYADRAEYIPYVKERIPELVVAGGQRESNLSTHKYAEAISNSKMTINFASHGMGYQQMKGKVLHAMASRTLLLEQRNPSTARLFVPQIDYIDFSSKDELVWLIKYFLENEKERLEIAQNGYNKFLKNYTAQIFWDKVMSRL